MNSSTIGSLDPPQWSLLVGSIGRICVVGAGLLLIASAICWLLSPKREILAKIGARCFTFGCIGIFGAMASVISLFLANRFEFEYVWEHADKSNALQYRLAGVWSGQQGSFLLWATTAAFFGLLAVRGTGPYRRWFTSVYSVFLACLSGILAYETPFKLNFLDGKPVVPADGVGLAPSLQNYWVVIHPPTIFMGFGALTVLAAYAFAALASNKVHDWIPRVRPWSIAALTLLGVGLCMGGFWAYETLGWGGFWMWDPVENVSFVPWIMTVALVHGIIVQNTSKRWTVTNLLLGGAPFLLFVYGTFLTRSGVLGDTSVHSFANMDHIAQKLLLGFLAIASVTFIALWAYRARTFKPDPDHPPTPSVKGFHREGFYRLGAILLTGFAISAAIGMSMPMFMALAGKQPKVVEEALYHKVLVWMYVPLMLIMAAAPLVAWRGMEMKVLLKRIYGVLCVTLSITGLAMIVVSVSPWTKGIDKTQKINFPFNREVGLVPWILTLTFLSVAVIVSNAWRISELFKRSKLSSAAFLAHIGVAVLMAGLVVSRGFEQKASLMVQEDAHDFGLGYLVQYKGQTSTVDDRNNKAIFQLRKGNDVWTARPGYYMTTGPDGTQNPMVWPHIEHRILYDLYFALHAPVQATGTTVTLQPGQTGKLDKFSVTYLDRTMKGTPGMSGTQFGALLKVSDETGTSQLNPVLELSGQGPIDRPAPLGKELKISLKRMDAATGSATLELLFAKPIYPVDFFYKPLTILVWLGTGILGFAGFLSAFYRRRRIGPQLTLEADSDQNVENLPVRKRKRIPA
jgi:cytochrome c-type biogenesis protein CcmF